MLLDSYLPVYTDGSKAVGHVGCGVVFNNIILSFSLHNSMSVFSAELTAILIALQHILISNHRHFCVYTDSMSTLESLHFLTERRHPTVIEILILLRKLERKGFHIIFSWVPGHVGILGNEQADTAARSMSDHMQRPVCCQDLKTFTQNYIHHIQACTENPNWVSCVDSSLTMELLESLAMKLIRELGEAFGSVKLQSEQEDHCCFLAPKSAKLKVFKKASMMKNSWKAQASAGGMKWAFRKEEIE
ncbi:putative RNA-directed DNA polymerase from transposon X-element [Trichonephila clavipes]|nr:putative RNA-directed DNA polymerase from transposon X-element [Trichonephila clavipes]